MGRPAKAIVTQEGHILKDDSKARLDLEKILKGGDSALDAPDDLTPAQKAVYDYLKAKLEAAGIIGELHSFSLVRLSICIDRLNKLEKDARKRPDLIYDKDFISAQREYTRQYEKMCAEFCLTPQAMAKMSIAMSKMEVPEKKTLGAILRED